MRIFESFGNFNRTRWWDYFSFDNFLWLKYSDGFRCQRCIISVIFKTIIAQLKCDGESTIALFTIDKFVLQIFIRQFWHLTLCALYLYVTYTNTFITYLFRLSLKKNIFCKNITCFDDFIDLKFSHLRGQMSTKINTIIIVTHSGRI